MKLIPLALAALVLSACAGDEGPTWATGQLAPEYAVAPGLAVPLENELTLRFGPSCVQLDAGEVRTACISLSAPGGGQLGGLSIDGRRVVWGGWNGTVGSDDPTTAAVDHAVVWSNLWPNGHRADVYVDGDLQQLAWVMADGEEPWGVQLIDARGRLVQAFDLVGLPGD